MGNTKKYWTGVDELLQTETHQEAITNEFAKEQSIDEFLGDDRLKESSTGRRDFLKFMGFSLGAATLAACEAPVIKSIPYVNKPDEIVPGVANYYASTYYDGHDYASVMVKTREGRPIFIKGNKDFGIAHGAVNARINSSVLGLYDSARLRGPQKNGANCSWADLDAAVAKGLADANGSVTIVSNTIISPSTHRAIEEFKAAHGANHVQYDSRSYNGVRKAHESTHGKAAIPRYIFKEAKVIASFGCDFLGSYMVSNIFSHEYGHRRKPEGEWMSKHYQFESNMSLTGSNADVRTPVSASNEAMAVAALHAAITGGSKISIEGADEAIASAAADLQAAGANGLVMSGSNDPNVQILVNGINSALGSYGTTVDIEMHANLYQGDDAAMAQLVKDMNAGQVNALIVYGCNPSYDWYDAAGFNAGLAKVATTVSTNLFADETGARCKYLAPDCHALESWNDLNPAGPRIDMVQPTISPLFDSRQTQESLLKWSGNDTDYYTYLRQTHNEAYTAELMPTDTEWHTALHNGTFVAPKPPSAPASEVATDAEPPIQIDASGAVSAVRSAYKGGGTELSLYQSVAIGNGAQGANPWLQELPDPITKVTWDNYIGMSPADMNAGGYRQELGQNEYMDVATVTVNGASVTLPVFPVPGQKTGTVSIALGYGRGAGQEAVGKAAFQTGQYGAHLTDENGNKVPIGANAAPLASMVDGCVVYSAANIDIQQTGADYQVATTQMHNTIMGRDSIVRETTLAAYMAEKGAAKGDASWNKRHALATHATNEDGSAVKKPTRDFDMWKEHPVEDIGHRWGMAIDLNSCIGCGSCVTACHIENNVPVVGKDEVLRHRDMHWMRIDRFFASEFKTHEETKEETGLGGIGAYKHMEQAAENPETVHMPMMCQHCNHAPCETVCPVAATTHSNEGLNQMAYNRCIGTRYCANNCPYKVRRFNWFNYSGYKKFEFQNPAQDELTRMVLNPDVVVRSRGVMEKCSMCVQRIQAGKFDAKKDGRPVADGEIQSACAEACPTHAITFGDHNDKSSQVRAEGDNNRSYHALEEVGVQPNIFYMTKVRNNNEA